MERHEHSDHYDGGLLKLKQDSRPHRGTKKWPGGQIAMIALALRFKFFILSCGRRSGKTSSNLFLGIEEQGRHDGYYYMMHISTDHSKAKEMFEATLKVMGGDPKHNAGSLVKKFRRNEGQDRWIELHSLGPKNIGGKWYFFSGQYPNYEAIQGFMFPFHRLIIDEMQLQHPALLTQVVIPMSSDGPGKIIIEGHPKTGRLGNYLFKRDFLRGKNPDWPEYASFNIPFEGNPYNDPKDGRIGRDACVNRQEEVEEYDGLFGDADGNVFERVNEVCCLPVIEPPAWVHELASKHPLRSMSIWVGAVPHPRRKYVLAADWAKEKDFTIFMVFDRTTNHQVCVVRIRGAEYTEMFEWLKEISYRYNGAVVHGDGNGVGAAMGSLLRKRYGAGYREHTFHPSNKEGYVRRGQYHFNHDMVALLDIQQQKHEFELFQVIQPKMDDGMGGKHAALRFGHPPGEHDDFVDAYLMLAESLSASPVKERAAPHDGEDDPSLYDDSWFFSQAVARTREDRPIVKMGSITRHAE